MKKKLKWNKFSEKLPKVNKKFGESDYILIRNWDYETPYIGWYEASSNTILCAHHKVLESVLTVSASWRKLDKRLFYGNIT